MVYAVLLDGAVDTGTHPSDPKVQIAAYFK